MLAGERVERDEISVDWVKIEVDLLEVCHSVRNLRSLARYTYCFDFGQPPEILLDRILKLKKR